MQMIEQPNTCLLTRKTVYNSILYDVPTRIWFKILCFLPPVELKLKKTNKEICIHYQKYRFNSILAKGLFVCSCLLISFGGIFQDFSIMLLLGGGMTFLLSTIVRFSARREIASIGAEFMTLSSNEVPKEATLYEMSEIHSKTYGIRSISDITVAMDALVRNALIAIVTGCLFIYFLPFDIILLVLFSSILCLSAVINSGILFKRPPVKHH